VETDRAGRVRIQNDLTVDGFPDIYVVGDTASLEQDGKPLPGVAQVAIQQGRYAGRRIAQSLLGRPPPSRSGTSTKEIWPLSELVSQFFKQGRVRLSGIFAWLAWAGIHLQFLSTGSLRLTVFLQWIWSFLTGQIGVRLIVNRIPLSKHDKDIELPITSGGRK
jgi:NADH:ubiquinone reductase (H+-translocating)